MSYKKKKIRILIEINGKNRENPVLKKKEKFVALEKKMNGFIFSDKQENCKKNFKYVCVATIIAIVLGVSLDGQNHSPKHPKQSVIVGQLNTIVFSMWQADTEHYCDGGSPSDGSRERTPMPDGSAETAKRQEIPKLERYRLATEKRSKKVGRSRKGCRKFCSPHYRKRDLSLYQSKILQEINRGRNIVKKEEKDSLQQKEKREVLQQTRSKRSLMQAMMIIAVLVGTALVSHIAGHAVAAESLPFLDSAPIGIAIGTMLPALASPYNTEVANQRGQASEEIFPPNDERFRERPKISSDKQWILYQKLCANPCGSSKEILASICEVNIEISISQINRIRKEWGLSRKKGRPRKAEKSGHGERGQIKAAVQAQAGVKLFSFWLDENEKHEKPLNAINIGIDVYKGACAGEDFRLLHSKAETIEKKWKALALLSLLGIKRLSELDYHEHHLSSIVGSDYTYSTLRIRN
ncbi:MAG: hypothetical protein HY808_12660 [Nitrospirae bacterium]|nr:hypothetical protein [Nitrospirota bacterium]